MNASRRQRYSYRSLYWCYSQFWRTPRVTSQWQLQRCLTLKSFQKVPSRKVPLASDFGPGTSARGTPSFSGADLAYLNNETALMATRANRARAIDAEVRTITERNNTRTKSNFAERALVQQQTLPSGALERVFNSREPLTATT